MSRMPQIKARLRHGGAGYITDATCLRKWQGKDVFRLLRKTDGLFAARTPAGILFHMFGTAMQKAQLPYAVQVSGMWSRVVLRSIVN